MGVIEPENDALIEIDSTLQRPWPSDRGLTLAHNLYDTPAFFEGYSRLRRSAQGLDGTPEWPAIPASTARHQRGPRHRSGVRFGCFARWAAEQGADSVLGPDLAENMLSRARCDTTYPAVRFATADLEHLDLPAGSFDLAIVRWRFIMSRTSDGSQAGCFRRSSREAISFSRSSTRSTWRRLGLDGSWTRPAARPGRSIIMRTKEPGRRPIPAKAIAV
jgi:Methyltransferase domain